MVEEDVVEDDVEDDSERASDLVEGDLDKLETEVVEDDHACEDQREGEHLLKDVGTDLERGDVCKAQLAGDVAECYGEDALGPCDEEGCGGTVL